MVYEPLEFWADHLLDNAGLLSASDFNMLLSRAEVGGLLPYFQHFSKNELNQCYGNYTF